MEQEINNRRKIEKKVTNMWKNDIFGHPINELKITKNSLIKIHLETYQRTWVKQNWL